MRKSIIWSKDLRATSSAGFGGMVPAISKSKLLLIPEGRICVFTSAIVRFSRVSNDVIPRWRSLISNNSASLGLRISNPTRTTFLPSSAKLMERLAALNVFPSPEVVDVNIITFSFSLRMNCRLVRIERKISSIWLFWFSCTTMLALVLAVSLATATSARMGSRVRLTTSLWLSIL